MKVLLLSIASLTVLALSGTAGDAMPERVLSYQDVDIQPVAHDQRFPPNDFFPPKDEGRDFVAYIAIVVSPRGDVVDTKIVQANDKEFGEAALACARRWHFAPATLGGKAVGCATVLTMRVHVGTERAAGRGTRYDILRSAELAKKKQ